MKEMWNGRGKKMDLKVNENKKRNSNKEERNYTMSIRDEIKLYYLDNLEGER